MGHHNIIFAGDSVIISQLNSHDDHSPIVEEFTDGYKSSFFYLMCPKKEIIYSNKNPTVTCSVIINDQAVKLV